MFYFSSNLRDALKTDNSLFFNGLQSNQALGPSFVSPFGGPLTNWIDWPWEFLTAIFRRACAHTVVFSILHSIILLYIVTIPPKSEVYPTKPDKICLDSAVIAQNQWNQPNYGHFFRQHLYKTEICSRELVILHLFYQLNLRKIVPKLVVKGAGQRDRQRGGAPGASQLPPPAVGAGPSLGEERPRFREWPGLCCIRN